MDFIEIEMVERKSDWAMSSLQSHDYYELYFLTEGKRKIFFEDKMFEVDKNTVCIIPPFRMHKTEGGPYKRINLNISPNLLSTSEKTFLEERQKTIIFKLNPQLLTSFLPLLELAANIDVKDEKARRRLALSFSQIILYQMQKGLLLPLDSNAIATTSKRDTVVLRVVTYLNEHYREKLTLSILSSKFYVSINTLCTRFQSSMHCSIVQYLTFLRISKAKKLLTTSNKTMEEIAELCGFSSSNYFSLIFKKEVGLSPLNYRKGK